MRYQITGNYGTFTIRRVVECASLDDVDGWIGIMGDLEELGWEILGWPDGAEWDIVNLDETPHIDHLQE